MTRALPLALLLASTSAFAGGAVTTTETALDDVCVDIFNPQGNVVTRCSYIDGVLHTTQTPSGQSISVLIGEWGFVDYINDEVFAEMNLEGTQIIKRTTNDDGSVSLSLNHTDLCRAFTINNNTRYFDVSVQFAGGEIIHESLERTDSCD